MNNDALHAVREMLKECGIVIQPPGWANIDVAGRYDVLIHAFANRLALNLDEPLLAVLETAIDELPANEGITHFLDAYGVGAWYLTELDDLQFFSCDYDQFKDLIRISEPVESEVAAIQTKPVPSRYLIALLRGTRCST